MNDEQHFREYGYLVIDNFLPTEVALSLYDNFKSDDNWELYSQTRERHYSHFQN